MKDEQIIQQLINDRVVRIKTTKESHFWFFHTYFGEYVRYETADFQGEMFRITEDDSIKNSVIVAFRGSGKSTIMTLSYPIWSIMGRLQKKFVVIFAQTQQQAKLIMSNIRRELENNELLKQEMGPFEESGSEWGANSIVIPKYGARIMVVSSEQSIRGVRHGAYRPDLIICDDVEDLTSVKTREGRNKTHGWFSSEVLPIGDNDTKIVVIGNLLHEDSLLMRLRESIEKGNWSGVFRFFPLIDRNDRILWPGKFKNMNDIQRLKLSNPNENAWQREYLLNIVPEEDQLIFPEHLHYYDELPPRKDLRYVATAVDLAISQKDTADFTAMVSAYVCGSGDNLRIYILPNPVNERIGFNDTIERIEQIHLNFSNAGMSSRIYVEEVGYQGSVLDQLKIKGIMAEGFQPHGSDKRSRLALTGHHIQSGKVLFPRYGAEKLIEQLVGFGKEKHDDLVDSFSMVVLKTIEKNKSMGGFLITRW